jgi:hypothetical protein
MQQAASAAKGLLSKNLNTCVRLRTHRGICNRGRDKPRVREVSLASTTSATSSARSARTSIPRRQDKAGRTEREVLDESQVKRTSTKKSRVLRSSSSSSASSNDEEGSSSSSGSSSENKDQEEDGVLEKTDQEQLCVLGEGDSVRKQKRRREREKKEKRATRQRAIVAEVERLQRGRSSRS